MRSNFTLIRLALLPLTLFLVGCEPAQPASPAASSAPPPPPPAPLSRAADLPPGVIEAKDATGVWNQMQVEEFLKQELALTDLAIQPTGNDGYRGTGSDADGKTYTLIVKQAPGGIKVDWTHPTGSGKLSFGNPVR